VYVINAFVFVFTLFWLYHFDLCAADSLKVKERQLLAYISAVFKEQQTYNNVIQCIENKTTKMANPEIYINSIRQT